MNQVLLFRIGDALMGVAAEYVRETVVLGEQTTLPGISVILSGLIPLRGRAVPIVDLSKLLGHPAAPSSLALILEEGGDVLGVPVSEVIGYRAYAGGNGSDLFTAVEIDYEDVKLLSPPLLMTTVSARLQAV